MSGFTRLDSKPSPIHNPANAEIRLAEINLDHADSGSSLSEDPDAIIIREPNKSTICVRKCYLGALLLMLGIILGIVFLNKREESKTVYYSFISIGDWGGQDFSPWVTTGQDVAAKVGMPRVAREIRPNLILGVGDNFYTYGVNASTYFRFERTFETVFDDESLNVPWFIVAGNHDHHGDVEAQIQYTQISSRWKFHNYFYDVIESFDGPKGTQYAHFIFLDTQIFDWEMTKLYGIQASDTNHFDDNPLWPNVTAHFEDLGSLVWLEDKLSRSTADYVFVVGHYPVWSVCVHGPTPTLQQTVKPLLEKYNVTAYIAGHDHCQSVVHEEEDKPIYPLAGNGVECCYPAIPKMVAQHPEGSIKFTVTEENQGSQISGFASYRIHNDYLSIHMHDQNGETLYKISKSRNR